MVSGVGSGVCPCHFRFGSYLGIYIVNLFGYFHEVNAMNIVTYVKGSVFSPICSGSILVRVKFRFPYFGAG